MTTNNKDFQKEYMRFYRKNSNVVICDDCGIKYKKVYKYNHLFSKNHKNIINFKNNFISIDNFITI